MLPAHVVVGAVVSPLEHCPERFHAVGVRLVVYELAYAVPDRYVVWKSLVSGVFVRVDGSTGGNAVRDEGLQGRPVLVVDDRHADGFGLAVLGTYQDGLAYAASSGSELLGFVLVAFLAADVGSVYLDRAGYA